MTVVGKVGCGMEGLDLAMRGRLGDRYRVLKNAYQWADWRYHLKLWIGFSDESAAYLPA
jgi:hypothetical protein